MYTLYAQKNQHNYIHEMQRIQANHLKIKKLHWSTLYSSSL